MRVLLETVQRSTLTFHVLRIRIEDGVDAGEDVFQVQARHAVACAVTADVALERLEFTPDEGADVGLAHVDVGKAEAG